MFDNISHLKIMSLLCLNQKIKLIVMKNLPTDKFAFFNQFSKKQIIAQAKRSIEGFEYMLKRARESKTGKYNGFTPVMLQERIAFYKKSYSL